jgi:type IV secretion system protein VirD4
MRAFYEEHRFGSGQWADDEHLPPLLRSKGPNLGLDGRGRLLNHPGDGPATMIAGSGGGKGLSGGLMFNACIYPGSMLVLDFKGEIASVSLAVQAAMGKYAYCVNPARVLGLPNHATDPLDLLRSDVRTLVPDAKMISEMLVPLSGAKEGKYFEEMARLLLEALMLTDVEEHSTGSLRNLYRIVNAIEGDAGMWAAFLRRMLASKYEHVRSIAGEMIFKREDAPKEFSGIVSDAKKTLSFLDDPAFLHSLESPSFSLSVLCERPCNVYINIPAEYVGIWGPYLRLLVGVAMLYKQRRPEAPRVYFMLDECGQLGRAEFLLRAMTFGRGAGILTQAVFQDLGQITRHYGREGVQTFMASSQVRQVFGVRDLETAELVSRMLGTQTLSYDAELEQSAARRNKAHIIRELMAGGDPFEVGLNYAQQARASVNRTKMARSLLTPDELLRMPEDRQVLFVSGVGCPPIAAYRKPYFQHRSLAGKFLPNPYHPPLTHVRVPGRFGMRTAKVITEPVPEKFAEFPQYQSGLWSYVEGYKPS